MLRCKLDPQTQMQTNEASCCEWRCSHCAKATCASRCIVFCVSEWHSDAQLSAGLLKNPVTNPVLDAIERLWHSPCRSGLCCARIQDSKDTSVFTLCVATICVNSHWIHWNVQAIQVSLRPPDVFTSAVFTPDQTQKVKMPRFLLEFQLDAVDILFDVRKNAAFFRRTSPWKQRSEWRMWQSLWQLTGYERAVGGEKKLCVCSREPCLTNDNHLPAPGSLFSWRLRTKKRRKIYPKNLYKMQLTYCASVFKSCCIKIPSHMTRVRIPCTWIFQIWNTVLCSELDESMFCAAHIL